MASNLFVTMVESIKSFFEKHAFGVCNKLGEVMGVSSGAIRLFFIYASFLAIGSPIIIYMSLAFLFNMRKHFRRKSNIVWDL